MKEIMSLTFVLLMLFISAHESLGQTKTATDLVRNMLDEVMAIQNNPELQGQGLRDKRRGLIQKVILKSFDFENMSKNALGAEQWNALKPEQRSEFRSIFQGLFLDSYSRLVLEFLKKERIEYRGEETAQGKAIVRSIIHRVEGQLPVDYLLTNLKNGWLVSDVIIDGVSIVGNYHNAFSRIIKIESYSGLLKRMQLQQKATQAGE
ncbi:MAG: ABC transporter substrate-binding protein [Syntrophorhabdales bacterium]|nr:ABC transporter substrate-binding protein [Syntrophorhabdales bacterium]